MNEQVHLQTLSVVLIAGASLEKLVQCMEHLKQNMIEQHYELIVVETIPNSEITSWLAEQSGLLTLFSHQQLNYAQACNKGLEIANYKHILVVNDHILMSKDGLANLCLTHQLNNSTASVFIHVNVRELNSELSSIEPFDLSMECFVMSSDIFAKIGRLDEQFHTARLMALDFLTRANQNQVQVQQYRDRNFFKAPAGVYLLDDLLHADIARFRLKWNKQPEKQRLELAIADKKAVLATTQNDIAVITNQLENVADPQQYLAQISSQLHAKEQVILNVSNAMNANNIKRLLNGNWSHADKQSYDSPTSTYTLDDIKHLVTQQEYDVVSTYGIPALSMDAAFVRSITNMIDPQLQDQLLYSDYVLLIQKSQLSAVFEQVQPESLYEQVAEYPDQLLMDHIQYKQRSERQFELYNTLGVLFFEQGHVERVLPYFKAALQIEPENKELMFNIAYFLMSIGDYDTAIKYVADLRELDLNLFDQLMGMMYEELNTVLRQLNHLPTVSIIVRTKNRKDLLQRCLESINRQFYTSIEVVVINDGGEDVQDILDNLNYPYLYERYEQSVGRAAALNQGLKLATGSYINIVDDDDLIYPNHIALLMSEVIFNEQRVVYSNALLRSETKQGDNWQTKSKSLRHSQDFDYMLLRQTNYIPILTALFERDLALQIGGANEDYGVLEDWDFWIRLSDVSGFYHIREVTSEYSQRESSDNATQTDWHLFGEVRDRIYQNINGVL
ncbi:glycosyltransferase [Paenibacillus sp. WLX1005]|uniref:glycosyltransferase n=1 Tax=Paenibacillus sp. WLX1005 TaxID=3243766 RepID=UPI0039841BDA